MIIIFKLKFDKLNYLNEIGLITDSNMKILIGKIFSYFINPHNSNF